MSRSGRLLALLAATFVASIAAAPPALADDLVDLDSGSSVTLPASANATLVVPITPVGGTVAADLTAGVVRVLRDSRPTSSEMAKAVAVHVEPALPALVFTVAADTLERAGDYLVTVSVGSGDRQELVDVTIRRESAAITTPSTIEVRRTVWFPELDWCFLCSERLADFRLIAGADTRVGTLNAFGTDPGSGQIVIDGVRRAPDSVEPLPTVSPPLTGGASLPLAYRVEGRPDLGTVVRHVRIDSPQLTAPLTTEFRITTKRHPLLIVVIAALGLITGLLVRKLLVGLRDRAAQVERAAELADELRRIRNLHTDAPFRREIDTQLGALNQITMWRPGSTTAAIKTIVDKAETAANAALQAVAAGTKEVRDRLTPIETDLRVDWLLPADLRALLDNALAQIDRIDTLVDAGNPTEARRELGQLDETRKDLIRQAIRHTQQVSGEAKPLADALQQAPAGSIASMSAAATQLAQTASPPADASLRDALRAAHQTEVDRTRLIAGLQAAVNSAIDTVSPPNRPALRTAAQPLLDLLTPQHSLADVANALPGFLAALKAGGALGPAGGFVVAETQREPAGVGTRARAERPVEQVASRSRRVVAAGLAAGSEVLRLVLLGALISVLAYGVFAGDWVGTFAQAVTVFTWAFVIDIGVEAVRAVMPAAPPTP